LDEIAKAGDAGEWRMLSAAHPDSAAALARVELGGQGTVVLWEKMDRVTPGQQTHNDKHHQRFLDRIAGVRSHLGMVFHRFLEGDNPIEIRVNGHAVEPWSPFLDTHPATHRLPADSLRLNGVRVVVQPFVLPHFSKLSKAEHAAGGGPHGWLAHQGFYIYRRDRLVVAGDWLGLGWSKDEHLKLARIAVDVPNGLDHEWQLNVTKSRATLPLSLRDDLKRVAERTRAEAKNVFTHRGTRLVSHNRGERVHLWQPMAKHDRTFYRISRDHPLVTAALAETREPAALRALLTLLEETIPLQHISIAGSERAESQPQPFEDTDEKGIRTAMAGLFRAMRAAGMSAPEARARLGNHWPFELFPHLVATFDEDPVQP
jgi:hypothetical protein